MSRAMPLPYRNTTLSVTTTTQDLHHPAPPHQLNISSNALRPLQPQWDVLQHQFQSENWLPPTVLRASKNLYDPAPLPGMGNALASSSPPSSTSSSSSSSSGLSALSADSVVLDVNMTPEVNDWG